MSKYEELPGNSSGSDRGGVEQVWREPTETRCTTRPALPPLTKGRNSCKPPANRLPASAPQYEEGNGEGGALGHGDDGTKVPPASRLYNRRLAQSDRSRRKNGRRYCQSFCWPGKSGQRLPKWQHALGTLLRQRGAMLSCRPQEVARLSADRLVYRHERGFAPGQREKSRKLQG